MPALPLAAIYIGMTTETTALTRSKSTPATMRQLYANSDQWLRYQEFFPAAMRCTPATTPVEEWWSWSGLDVHLDRSPVPTSPMKVIVLHGAGAYGRVMAPAAVLASRHGFETVSPDLPGYGMTRIPNERFTYSLWVDCVRDLMALGFLLLFNALTYFGDLIAIGIPLLRRQGIDRGAWTSAAFALPAGLAWLVVLSFVR